MFFEYPPALNRCYHLLTIALISHDINIKINRII